VIIFCSGAATQAGLVAARKLLRLSYRLVGVSASPFIPDKPAVIARVASRALRLLGSSISVFPDEVTNLADYIGAGYGALTAASIEAQRLAARTEGLLLDPTYTAKAMAALIDHVRATRIRPDEHVLFIHTGGVPAVFLARNEIVAGAEPRA
jgi:L-cysteate sulfo-lyase